MRFTVWSENYDQCFKKSKKILKLKTFSVSVAMASCSPGSQRGDDAVGAEAMQTLFGRHGVLQHVQTDGTHQLAVQRARRHGHLRPIHDRLLNTHTHTLL